MLRKKVQKRKEKHWKIGLRRKRHIDKQHSIAVLPLKPSPVRKLKPWPFSRGLETSKFQKEKEVDPRTQRLTEESDSNTDIKWWPRKKAFQMKSKPIKPGQEPLFFCSRWIVFFYLRFEAKAFCGAEWPCTVRPSVTLAALPLSPDLLLGSSDIALPREKQAGVRPH